MKYSRQTEVKLRPSRIDFSQAMCASVPDYIQGDLGIKVNVLRGDAIGHCEKKLIQTCV
jgi:hypothetical protein